MKAWSRRSGNGSACAPTRRARRTIGRRAPSEPSALSARPSGGESSSACQLCSGICSTARRTRSCWLTPIEERAPCCSSAAIVFLLRTSWVGAQQRRARRAEATHTRQQLPPEALRAAIALRRPLAHARVQPLAAVGPGRQERALAAPLRVPETRALPGLAGDRDDRCVESIVSGSGPRPTPAAQARARITLEAAVELAPMPERKRAQKPCPASRAPSRGARTPAPSRRHA